MEKTVFSVWVDGKIAKKILVERVAGEFLLDGESIRRIFLDKMMIKENIYLFIIERL